MTKSRSRITAQFVPDESTSLAETLYALSIIENPRLASALARSYPILMLVDELVLFLTWTNSNLYSNSLAVVLFSLAVRYWSVVSHTCLPLILALAFCWLAFHARSSKEAPATIDDVLHTLYNLSIRMDIILSPLLRLTPAATKLTVYWSPVYILLTTSVISPPLMLWLVGCFILTIFLPWAYVLFQLASRCSWSTSGSAQLLKANKSREVPPPAKFDIQEVHDDSLLIDKGRVKSVLRSASEVTLTSADIVESTRRMSAMETGVHPEPLFENIPNQENGEHVATGYTRRKVPPPYSENASKSPVCDPSPQLSERKPNQISETVSTETPARRRMAPPPDFYVSRQGNI